MRASDISPKSVSTSRNKSARIPLIVAACYLVSAAVVYLVCATGGTPSIYANLILIPIIVVALITPVWHSAFFASLCGLAIGPLICLCVGGDWKDFSWLIRLFVYVVVSVVISVISRKIQKREAYFEELATHDSNTGLMNLNCLSRQEAPSDGVMSILMLSFLDSSDMEGLFGNDFYNSIIRRIAKELIDLIKPYPNATLYKGTDLNFAIAVKHHSNEESLENLLASLSNINDVTITIDQVPVYVSYRIGFTVIKPGDSVAEGMRNANIALRYSFLEEQQISRYTDAMRDYYKGTVSIASEFSSAISKGMVQASHQTIHNAKTREAESVEILAKWIREDGSKMTAEEFVPILERTSCLHELTMFMTKEALRYAQLQGNNVHDFSINFSAKELNDRSVQEFVRTIENSGISPEHVMVEINGRFPDDPYIVRENLMFLHKHKIRIAIDYFSSALSAQILQSDVPVDVIKICRKITAHVENERGYALIKSVVAFARGSGIKTVAEGIENENQARLCEQAGVDYLQGYHFSVPRLLRDVEAERTNVSSSSEDKNNVENPTYNISVVKRNEESDLPNKEEEVSED